MSTDEIIAHLEKFDSILSLGDFFSSAFRQLGWWIVQLLSLLLDSLSSGQKEMIKMISFYSSPEFLQFLSKYNVVLTGLGTITVMFLALKMSKANNADRKGSIAKYADNVFLAIILTVGLPSILGLMVGVFTPAASENLETSASSVEIYKSNITDLYRIDENGWDKIETVNDIQSKNDLKYVDINELVDTGGFFFDSSPLSSEGKDMLSKKLSSVNGKPTLSKLKSHWVVEDDAYFRYSWHPFLMMIELAIRNVVAIFVMFKIAQMSLELAVVSGILKVSAWTDLENGKRNRDLFIKVRNILIVLYLTIVMQSVFSLFSAYMKTTQLNPVAILIAMAAGCLLTLAGPSTIEQIFGVDAGVGSGFGSTLMGLGQASRMAGGVMHAGKSLIGGAAGVAKNAGKGASYASSATAGALAGFRKGGSSSSSKPTTTQGTDSGSSAGSSNGAESKGGENTPLSRNDAGKSSGQSQAGNSSTSKSGGGQTPLGNKEGTTSPGGTDSKESTSGGVKPDSSNGSDSSSSTPLGQPTSPESTPLSGENQTNQTQASPLGQSSEKEKDYVPKKTDTVGSIVKGSAKSGMNKVTGSSFVQKNKRVYQVSKNTTNSLIHRTNSTEGDNK